MIEHFQTDDKWTFTFVGCGSLEDVTATSAMIGVASCNTMNFCSTDLSSGEALRSVATSYSNYAMGTKSGKIDKTLFIAKTAPIEEVKK